MDHYTEVLTRKKTALWDLEIASLAFANGDISEKKLTEAQDEYREAKKAYVDLVTGKVRP